MRGYRGHHQDRSRAALPHTYKGRHGRWAMDPSPVRTSFFTPPSGRASLGPAEAALEVSGLWPRSRTLSPGYNRSREELSGGRAGSAIS